MQCTSRVDRPLFRRGRLVRWQSGSRDVQLVRQRYDHTARGLAICESLTSPDENIMLHPSGSHTYPSCVACSRQRICSLLSEPEGRPARARARMHDVVRRKVKRLSADRRHGSGHVKVIGVQKTGYDPVMLSWEQQIVLPSDAPFAVTQLPTGEMKGRQ